MGALRPERLARSLAQQYRLQFQSHIDDQTLDKNLILKFPINYAKKNALLPLGGDGNSVTVAIADPANFRAAGRSADALWQND